MKFMDKIARGVASIALALLVTPALAQFLPGQVLTAQQLNSTFAQYMPLAGGTLTGPLTVPSLSVTGSPIPFASGGTGATTALAATSNLQFQGSGAGTIARSVSSKLSDHVNLLDFGAKCDGSSDDSGAFNLAYAAAPVGGEVDLPAATCAIAYPIVFSQNKHVSWRGEGSKQSIILYNGSNTMIDMVTFGDGVTEEKGVRIEGIGFQSSTLMLGGTGVHFKIESRMNIRDVNFGDRDTANNLYNGVWYDGVANVNTTHYQAYAQNDALRVNGAPGSTSGPRSDLFLSHGLISGATVGVHIGGAFGGFYVDSTDVITNATNVLIDTSLNSAGNNRETFFGPGTYLDSAGTTAAPYTGTDLDIEDTSGFVFLNNTWVASASTLIKVGSTFAGRLTINGGILFNAFTSYGGNGYALYNNSSSASIAVNGTRMSTIAGAGIYSSVATNNIILNHPIIESGVVNPIGANVGTSSLTDYSNSAVSMLSTLNVTGAASLSSTLGVYGVATFYNPLVVSYPSAALTVNDSSGTGSAIVSLQSNGTNEWSFAKSSANNFNLSRYVGGALQDNPISVANSTGIVTIPDGLVLKGTTVNPNLTGTTGSIGGSALSAGACTSGTASVSGSTTSMAVAASPAASPGSGFSWSGYVSAAGTVTVNLCAIAAGTPTATTYNVRVLQ